MLRNHFSFYLVSLRPSILASRAFPTCQLIRKLHTPHTRHKIFDKEIIDATDTSNSALQHMRANLNATKNFRALQFNPAGECLERTIPKDELLKETKIEPRDLRVIDTATSADLASILVREKSILVNIVDIKMVIQWDRVLLFENGGEHTNAFVSILKSMVEMHERKDYFEFRALEAVLVYVGDLCARQVESMRNPIEQKTHQIQLNPENEDDSAALHDYKNKLNLCEEAVNEILKELNELLNNDDDMANMYLTVKSTTTQSQPIAKHDKMEILLENYVSQFEQILSRIRKIKSSIFTAEEFANIQLDSTRNRIMYMSLLVSVGAMFSSLMACVFGAFGMNLISGLENHPTAFYSVLYGTVVINFLGFLILKKISGIKIFAKRKRKVLKSSKGK